MHGERLVETPLIGFRRNAPPHTMRRPRFGGLITHNTSPVAAVGPSPETIAPLVQQYWLIIQHTIYDVKKGCCRRVHLEIVDAACDCGRRADVRRLRSVLALGRGAPTHPPWRRSARGLPCDRSRRRFPHNSTISRCTRCRNTSELRGGRLEEGEVSLCSIKRAK